MELDFKFNNDPFPHVIINNFYSEQELSRIFRELEFLTSAKKLDPPKRTGTSKEENGDISKNNFGLFLEDVYMPHQRKVSDILTLTKKVFCGEVCDLLDECHWFYKFIGHSTKDTTLVSYYENGGYYKPHIDTATITVLTHFFKEPQQFTGGELVFNDYDYSLPTVNNRAIFFPSIMKHSVNEIKLEGEPMSGLGRYTISQFFHITY